MSVKTCFVCEWKASIKIQSPNHRLQREMEKMQNQEWQRHCLAWKFASFYFWFQFQTIYIRRQNFSWVWIEEKACFICSNSIGCTYSLALHWGRHWFSMQSNQQQLRLRSTHVYTTRHFFLYFAGVESILITHAESPSTWSTNLWKLFDFCIYENIGESIVQSLFSHSSNWGFYLKTFGIGSIAVAVLNNCGTDIIVNHELMHLKAIDDQYYKERFLGDDDLLRSKRTN